jgi:hypothetical protein
VHEFRYVLLFSDASGESHFQDIADSPDSELSVPPAPPLRMRALGPAVTVALVGGDSGLLSHPRQYGLTGTSAESVRRSLRRARS